MARVVPLKPACIRYAAETELSGGAEFALLPNLRELCGFWETRRHLYSYVARGRRWGSRQLFLHPGEWVFAPTIPALVRAVTRWDEMHIRVEWQSRAVLDPKEQVERVRQSEQLRRLLLEPNRDTCTELQDIEERAGYWQLLLPPGLRSFIWFTEHSSRIHYPGLTCEQASEIFQLRTYEDWRQSNMREVDFMRADDLDDLISCCQGTS